MPRVENGQIVSRTELARFFGRSVTTIDHWINTGCPVVRRGRRGSPWEFRTSDVANWLIEKASEQAGGQNKATEAELKIRKLTAETEQAELALAIAKKEVTSLDQIERGLSTAFAEVKTALRALPSRVVTTLIGETDEVKFKAVMLEEIDRALDSLADAALVNEYDLDDEE